MTLRHIVIFSEILGLMYISVFVAFLVSLVLAAQRIILIIIDIINFVSPIASLVLSVYAIKLARSSKKDADLSKEDAAEFNSRTSEILANIRTEVKALRDDIADNTITNTPEGVIFTKAPDSKFDSNEID